MIVVGGTIGAGKTTVAKRLSESFNSKLFLEPVDNNPILDKYYEDRERYGFSLQIYFLNKRFRLIKRAYEDRNNVLDRSIYEDALFTKINYKEGNISEEEYLIYLDLLDNMMEELEGLPKKAPDIFVYLDISFENMLKNIKKRNRPYEQISEDNGLYEYYKKVHNMYKDWYDNYNISKKVKIDMNKFDALKDEDWELILDIVKEELNK